MTRMMPLALAVLFMGCATGRFSSDDQSHLSDTAIASEVTRRLSDDDVAGRKAFGVRVEQGVATIQGAVSSQQMRARVLAITQSTPGVTGIVDRLSVW